MKTKNDNSKALVQIRLPILILGVGCAIISATPVKSAVQPPWLLNGNNVAPGNFLGSTNDQPVEIRANGARVLRLEPDSRGAFAGNIIGGYTNNVIEQPGSGGDVIAGGGFFAGPNIIRSNSSGVFIGAGSANEIGPNVNDAVIAGGFGNRSQGFDSFIGAGFGNAIQVGGFYSGIGGGFSNRIAGARHAFIGGGSHNLIETNATAAALGGGSGNSIGAGSDFTVIGGGVANQTQSSARIGTIAGGFLNSIESFTYSSTIGGGYANQVQSAAGYAIISGGRENTIGAQGFYATIGGGGFNTMESGVQNSVIAGGIENRMAFNGNSSAIGGGWQNLILTNVDTSVIGGGYTNTIGPLLHGSTIAGGWQNAIGSGATWSAIGGGISHLVKSGISTVSGGSGNTIENNASGSTIGGGSANHIQPNAFNATISGGSGNTVAGYSATVAGGIQNSALGNYSFAAGQQANAGHQGAFVWADSQNAPFSSTASDQFSVRANGGVRFVTGGAGLTVDGQPLQTSQRLADDANHSNIVNVVQGSSANSVGNGVYGATISGGGADYYNGIYSLPNVVTADFGTVGGGERNTSSGIGSTVAGGSLQTSSGDYAVTGGGFANTSSGDYAAVGGGYANTAAGYAASVPGGLQNAALGSYSFAAGTRAQANHPGSFVWASGNTRNYATIFDNAFNVYAAGGHSFDYGTQSDATPRGEHFVYIGSFNAGNTISVWNGASLTDGGIWSNASDKNRKTDFTEVNPRDVLERLAALPVREWRYTNEASGVKHLGPTAQDFQAAFGLGSDDKSIGTVDADGVALAAIQALNQKIEQQVNEKENRIQSLERRLRELEKLIARGNSDP